MDLQSGLQEFEDEIRAVIGGEPGAIQADGRFHRFSTNGKRGDNSGWYVAYANGDFVAGAFGSWKDGSKYKWHSKNGTRTAADHEQIKQMFDVMEKQREKVKKAAQQRARKVWDNAKPADPKHPYLIKKGIQPHGARQYKGALIIPVMTSDGELMSIQFINKEGVKRFFSGAKVTGGSWTIPGSDDQILSEGFATAASIREATGATVRIAFNAANLVKVAKPGWTIAADNDAFTKDRHGDPWNPGQEKALMAAWTNNCGVVIPEFTDLKTKPTDFNDLAQLEGNETVRAQIEMAKFPQEWLLEESEDDKGAAFRPEHLEGLNELKRRDLPGYRNLRHKLKKLQVGVVALDGAMVAKGGGVGNVENPEESAAAEIITKQLINIYAFDKKSEKWLQYLEGFWSDTQRQDIKESVSKIMRDSDSFPAPYKNFYFNGITQLLRNHLPFTPKDEDRNLLPFKNGVLNIKTKTLEPNDPGYGFTWQLPYEYASQADCQPIIDWLYEMAGKKPDLVNLLRAFLCAVLFGWTELHRFLELVGPGGTGKSTFIWLAEQMIGVVNAITSELKFLEKNRFETASIYLKRLVLITDAERYAGEVSTLKALTGGDPLRYEEKYVQSKNSFHPKAMVILAANEPIQSKDYTSGLQRRRITIYFKNQIPLEKQRDLKVEFSPHIPGLINWVLDMDRKEAATILKSRGSKVQLSDFKENLVATNPIAEWLHENTVYMLECETKAYIGVANKIRDENELLCFEDENIKLYPNYAKFCGVRQVHPVSLKRFRGLLTDLIDGQLHLKGVKDTRDNQGRYFTGIQLRGEKEGDREKHVSPVDAALTRDEGEV